jgi:hypothetical protein
MKKIRCVSLFYAFGYPNYDIQLKTDFCQKELKETGRTG